MTATIRKRKEFKGPFAIFLLQVHCYSIIVLAKTQENERNNNLLVGASSRASSAAKVIRSETKVQQWHTQAQ
jgi:hypothetical protein